MTTCVNQESYPHQDDQLHRLFVLRQDSLPQITTVHQCIANAPTNQEIRSNFFFIINTYLRSLEAISRACSGHPKGRLSFGSLSLWKILAMIIAEGLLNVASKIKNRPWFV